MIAQMRIFVVLALVFVPGLTEAEDVAVAGLTFPDTITDDQWVVFQDNVRSKASPPLSLKMMIRGEAGSEEVMIQALRRGRLQLAAPSLAGATSLVPELAVLQLPYLFDSVGQMDFIYDTVLPPYFEKLFRERGLVFLHWIDSGWLGFYGPEAVVQPELARGLKLRTAPTEAARLIAEAIGADAIYVAYTEIVPALQTGLIQGGMTSDYAFVTGGLAPEVAVFTLTRHSYDTGMMLGNARWFDRLSDTNKIVLKEAYGSSTDFRARSRAYSTAALEGLPETAGTAVVELTPEERAAWATATAGTHDKLLNRLGPGAEALYDVIMSGKLRYAEERGL